MKNSNPLRQTIWCLVITASIVSCSAQSRAQSSLHEELARSLQEADRFMAEHPLPVGAVHFTKGESIIAAANSLLWEPHWTVEVATQPLLFQGQPDRGTKCLKSCGGEQKCCSSCGAYTRGSWEKADEGRPLADGMGTEEVVGSSGYYLFGDVDLDPTLTQLDPRKTPANEMQPSKFYWKHQEGGADAQCILPKFTRNSFCRAVCGSRCEERCRKISPKEEACNATMIGLGDSTLRAQLAHLVHRLSRGVSVPGSLALSTHHGGAVLSCVEYNQETDVKRSVFLHVHALQLSKYDEILDLLPKYHSKNEKESIYVDHVRDADVLLVNVGPWDTSAWCGNGSFHGYGGNNHERVTTKARKLITGLKTLDFTGLLIFRTTARGHPYCWNHQIPYPNRLDAAKPWLLLREAGSAFYAQYSGGVQAGSFITAHSGISDESHPAHSGSVQRHRRFAKTPGQGVNYRVTRTQTVATSGSDSGARRLESMAPRETHDDAYFRAVATSYRWEFIPYVNRLFASELSRCASETDMKFSLLDVAPLAELHPHGHTANFVANNQDCLHYGFPSVDDWYNAHLLALLRDSRE